MQYPHPRLPLKTLFALCVFCLLSGPALAQGPRTGPRTGMLDSVEAALAYNPELKAYQEGRQLTVHGLDRAKAGYLPSLGLAAGGGASQRNDSNTRDLGEEHKFRAIADAEARLVQPVFHGFATTYGVERAQAELDSAENLLFEQGTSIAYAAIAAHLEVLRRAKLVELAQNNVNEHAEILENVQQRFDNGVATSGELNQVSSRHSRAKATLASYQSSLETARATYLRVTGRLPGDLQPIPMPASVYSSLEEARDATLLHNYSLKGYLAILEAALKEKGQAKSRFYPQLDLVAGSAWADRDSKKDAHVTDFSAEMRMSWEIISGGADMATLRMAGAKIRQARQNVHALMNSLNEDLESTFSRYLASVVEAAEYKDAKEASRRAREDYYRQFISARRSLIDVLDAENDYFYAACQEALSQGDHALAAYRLKAVSGALLPELSINPETLRVDNPTTDEAGLDNLRNAFDSALSGPRAAR